VEEKKISIITVCYNSEKTIRETFKSVLKQQYENYEYIVVDGKSKDGTLEIIKEYMEKFKGKMKYISEKDNGIYDAMNKGIQMATGEIIGLLNSDDYYSTEHTLNKINENLTQTYSGVFGDLIMLEDKVLNIPERKYIAGEGSYMFGWAPPHPTLYLKKEIYDEIGLYNQKYPVAADYDVMLKIMSNKKYKLKYINFPLVSMRPGGVSTNGIKGQLNSIKEAYKVLKKNKIPFALFISFCKLFRGAFKAIKAKIFKKNK